MQQAQQVPIKWYQDQYRSFFVAQLQDLCISLISEPVSMNSPALDKVIREMKNMQESYVEYTCENADEIFDDICFYLRHQLTRVDTTNLQRYRKAPSNIVRSYLQYRIELTKDFVLIRIAGPKAMHNKALNIALANLNMTYLHSNKIDFIFSNQAEKFLLTGERLSRNDGITSKQDVIEQTLQGLIVSGPPTINGNFSKYMLQIIPKL